MTETITYEQVGTVLGLAAARDQRTVGEADILAWHDDLNAAGITFGDVRAALTRFYVEQSTLEHDQRFRITTPDVIRMVRKIRAERVTNFVYEPANPDETGAQFQARYRAQLAAVANGHTELPSMRPALEGPPATNVAEVIRGVLRAVPDEDDEAASQAVIPRPGEMTVECPRPDCKARVGQRCRSGKRTRHTPHPARAALASGEPYDPDAERAEMERRRAASAAALAAHQEAQSA